MKRTFCLIQRARFRPCKPWEIDPATNELIPNSGGCADPSLHTAHMTWWYYIGRYQ